MGRYLDLLNARTSTGSDAVQDRDKSDISDQRGSGKGLSSLRSLMSHPETGCGSADPDAEPGVEKIEPEGSGVPPGTAGPTVEHRDLATELGAAQARAAAALASDRDPTTAAEAAAIRELAGQPTPVPHDGHRELIRPFLMAGLYRPPFWPDAVGHLVTPGSFCGACHGRLWWWGADTTAAQPDWRLPGWHCARCIPPPLGAAVRTMRSGEDGEPPGPHPEAGYEMSRRFEGRGPRRSIHPPGRPGEMRAKP